jgi:hypothetical protein
VLAVTTPPITRRQREVLDHLSEQGAFSGEKAAMTASGLDVGVAEKLAASGVINKRYDEKRGEVYWIRAEGEPATGASVPAGFVVILSRDVRTPSGRSENFFVARASYDGKGTTFRRLLRGWMQALGLRSKDLVGGTWGVEMIAADSPVFSGDHVILDEAKL